MECSIEINAKELRPLSRTKIIGLLAKALEFPPYWRDNWDSFEECLATALENKKRSIKFVHINWSEADFDRVNPYREILQKLASEFENLQLVE